jgi:molybdopterin-dependent oxidoreductase alpha subunit
MKAANGGTRDSGLKKKRNWVSLVPYGLNEQHPNAYKDMAEAMWENRDNLVYANRILNNGCCDGCALGTIGMRDWTHDGIHLCSVRLRMLRVNTMPAMDLALFEDVEALRRVNSGKLMTLGRLPAPMVRRKGDRGFTRISWDEAIDIAAKGLSAADPKRIGWFITSRGLTNEAYYAHQKAARFFGTNNVDTSARICHAPSTLALTATVGVAATTCSYKDWIGSDLIVFVGTNIANNQPVATKYLYYAKQQGTKVFVINPYMEPGLERYWIPSIAESALFGTKFTDDFFPVHIGGDTAFFYGVLKHLIEHDWVRHHFIKTRTAGWDELRAKVVAFDWDVLERDSGQTKADMYRFAQTFGRANSAIFVWSMGITQHRYGSDNVRGIVNLQLARGNVGREKTGLMPIRGHSGVQGGAEMGAQPQAYVMGLPVSEENAERLAASKNWGFAPPTFEGLTATQMIVAAEHGELDAIWQSGGNFVDTLPEPDRVRKAVGNIKLRIHQDICLSSNMLVDPADTVVLFPSRTRYEQRGGGTETSTERRIIFSPEIPGPRIDLARDEWELPAMVARRAGGERGLAAFPWRDTQDVREEIDAICPAYRGIKNLRKKGDQFQYGGPRLLVDTFPTPDGLGHFSVVDLPEERAPEGMFILATRRGKQFNSMVYSDKDPITGAKRDAILISAPDAARLGIADGDRILLRNELGEFHGRARIDRIAVGNLQGHWPEVNILVPAGCLDASGVPHYNAFVEVQRVGVGSRSPQAPEPAPV